MDAKATGAYLRKLRGGKATREIAKAIGISPSTLNMYERGERTPRDEIKVKLADYYGVGIGIFFEKEYHETQ